MQRKRGAPSTREPGPELSDRVRRLLEALNPQWYAPEGQIAGPPQPEVPRRLQAEAQEALTDRRILCVLGPRRTGKTTMLRGLIGDLLREGTPSRSILYFSFDETTRPNADLLDDLIWYHADAVDPGAGRRRFALLDEIHHVRDWQAILKRHHDHLHPATKFIVTGSSTLWIRRRAAESLVGRAQEMTLWPLSFREFVALEGIRVPAPPLVRTYEEAREFARSVTLIEQRLEGALGRFLLLGGFPEPRTRGGGLAQTHDYLRTSVVDPAVVRDLPRLFRIGDPSRVLDLFRIVASRSGSLFSPSNMAGDLGMPRQAVAAALFYLQTVLLVDLSYNYTKSRVKQSRSLRKAYVTDPGLAAATEHLDEASLRHTELAGYLAETAVQNHLGRRTETFFWRDEHKNEVDVVVRSRGKPRGIEVKYTAQIDGGDLRGLRTFQRAVRARGGIIATRALLRDFDDVWAVPIHHLLLWDEASIVGDAAAHRTLA